MVDENVVRRRYDDLGGVTQARRSPAGPAMEVGEAFLADLADPSWILDAGCVPLVADPRALGSARGRPRGVRPRLRPGGRALVCEGAGEEWIGSNPDWLDSATEMHWVIAGAEARREQLRSAGFAIRREWGAPETLEAGGIGRR